MMAQQRIGWFFFQRLRDEFSRSGYVGFCHTVDTAKKDCKGKIAEEKDYFLFFPVYGGNKPYALWGPFPDKVKKAMKTGTDILVLKQVAGPVFHLKKTMAHNGEPLLLDGSDGQVPLKAGAVWLISDCEAAELFYSKDSSKALQDSLTPASRLSRIYREKAEVVQLQTPVYYLGPRHDGENGYSLWTTDLLEKEGEGRHESAQEILSGVEDFQVAYLLPRPDGMRYRSARESQQGGGWQWEEVLAVKITLRLEKNEEQAKQENKSEALKPAEEKKREREYVYVFDLKKKQFPRIYRQGRSIHSDSDPNDAGHASRPPCGADCLAQQPDEQRGAKGDGG